MLNLIHVRIWYKKPPIAELLHILNKYESNDQLTYPKMWWYRQQVEFLRRECNKKRKTKRAVRETMRVFEHKGLDIQRSEIFPKIYDEVPPIRTWIWCQMKRTAYLAIQLAGYRS